MSAAVPAQPLLLRELVQPDPRWDDFVLAQPQARVFHLSGWAAVYGDLPWLNPCFIYAERAGAIVGVMPLARVRWGLHRSALVSAPYCVEAGALAVDDEVKAALEAEAVRRARALGVGFLEVRQSGSANPAWPGNAAAYCGFSRELAATAADNLRAIPRKQRAMIRKGEAAGLAAAASDDLDLFYHLFATSVRALGTPVYSRRLFAALARHLRPYLGLFTVRQGGETLAAVLSFYFKGWVMPYYAGALPTARAARAYDYLYWSLLQEALARGCTGFDFGRSIAGSGSFAYKKNWGFAPRPLCYQVLPLAAGTGAKLDPDSPFNRLARRAWRHLPLTAANVLGPWLSRRLY